MAKKRRKRRKLKKAPRTILLIIILVVLFLILKNSFNNYEETFNSTYDYLKEKIEAIKSKQDKKAELEKKYNDCLAQEYTEEEKAGNLEQKEIELTTYLQKYSVSVKFVDIKTNYTYAYNQDKIYYAASTIKMLDALYIYEEAAKGNINLDETVKYLAKFKSSYSAGMIKHKINDMVSLRDLVKYAITVSDNTAHHMLVNYIGYDNLKAFGNSLGATSTLNHSVLGKDNFGDMNVNDAIIYVKELYNFINNNSALGKELKSYFTSSQDNYLKDEDRKIEAATKYGQYNSYFHNNGIVYYTNPYYASILTELGNSNYKEIISNINKKYQELEDTLYSNRINYCQEQIYGSE